MASLIKVNTIKDLGGNTVLTSNGSGTISGLPASAISSGTVATARLGSGTASSSTFLAGDSSYKTVSGTTINNNADNRVITGSGTANTLEAEANVNITSGGNLLVGSSTASTGYSRVSLVGGHADGTGANSGVQMTYNSGAYGGGAITTPEAEGGGFKFWNFTGNVGSESYTEVMKIDGAGIMTKPLQPCFLVTKSGHQSSVPINAITTITFDTERIDKNADFSSNTFTAPVTGSYQFNFTITWGAWDKDFGYNYTLLESSNRRVFAHLGSGNQVSSDGYFNSGGACVIDMDANDTCLLKVQFSNDGAAQASASQSSYFSGFLIG